MTAIAVPIRDCAHGISIHSKQESVPLPSKLLARLHEVSHVFSSDSHRKATALALRERKTHGPGFSKKMNSLFCLWSNRLRETFHTNTYLMFMRLAQEDAIAGDAYGVECLFRFLSYGLEKSFRRDLFLDFEEVAVAQYRAGDLYGVEKYAAFWHYGGKNVVPHDMTPNSTLMHLISVKYPSLADFKGNRYQSKEPGYVLDVVPSHLGVEVPHSPAASVMTCSEFSFDGFTDDFYMGSSPCKSRLSASAPSFYPLKLMKPTWSSLKTPRSDAGKRVEVQLRARSGYVSVHFVLNGRPVTGASAPQPVNQPSAFAPPGWGGSRSLRNNAGGSYSSDVPFGRSPSGTGRATTAARPVGQPWKRGRGHGHRSGGGGRGMRTETYSEYGTSFGASSTGMSPIGMSPVGSGTLNAIRGGLRGRMFCKSAGPSPADRISVWPSGWEGKGHDRPPLTARSNASNTSRSFRPGSSWNPATHRGWETSRTAPAPDTAAYDATADTGLDLVTGQPSLDPPDDDRKSSNASDLSQMTEFSHDLGNLPEVGQEIYGSLQRRCSAQVGRHGSLLVQEEEIMRLRVALADAQKECAQVTEKLREWEFLGFR